MKKSSKMARFGCIAIAAALPLLAGCPETETETQPPADAGPGDPAWQVVLDEADLDGAVLSVWGSSPSDVFAVGGPLGNTPFETIALHFDGARWTRLAPGGGAETFWWVGGTGPSDVWMVGTEGRIAHWDGAAFTEHDSGTTATIWGVWAAAPDDAWAVGGSPGEGAAAPNDIVLHWDGAAWTPVALPGAPLGRALFKVWGTSSSDLYAVGEAGTIWHKKGADWTLESDPPLASGTLFTVNGCGAGEVYAVGNGDVLRSDGSAWSKVDVALTGMVNGVACNAPGEVLIVGSGGLKQRLVDGAWIDEFATKPYRDLHAAWADGAGTFWAVGGEWFSQPSPGTRRLGVVARYGPGTVADAIAP